MGTKELSERDKFILKEKIYPAIQSCVNNRYKIILGIFVYYGFILSNERIYGAFKIHRHFNLISSAIFSVFIIHNFFNYWLNGKEEIKLEEGEENFWPSMELFFGITTLILIWASYFLFRYYA